MLKIAEVAQICGILFPAVVATYVHINLDKKGFGFILDNIFKNSSAHPGRHVPLSDITY
jgi:hypothetical protein